MKSLNAFSMIAVIFLLVAIYACNKISNVNTQSETATGESGMKLNKLTKEEMEKFYIDQLNQFQNKKLD